MPESEHDHNQQSSRAREGKRLAKLSVERSPAANGYPTRERRRLTCLTET